MRYFCFSLLFLASCQRPTLSCRTEYLYPTFLASEQIDTPDPYRLCYYGQQIVVRWSLPACASIEYPLLLVVEVRYGTREIESFTHRVEGRKGFWTFRLVNKDYWCREGIVAYKVNLCQDGESIDQWTHHLWSEILEISQRS